MALLAILLFTSNFLIGSIVVNYFLSILPQFAKLSASFFLGTYISTIIIFIAGLLFQKSDDPLLYAIILTFIVQLCSISYFLLKKTIFI